MKVDSGFRNEFLSLKGIHTIKELSYLTGVNRWTLSDVLKEDKTIVASVTYFKLKKWAAKQQLSSGVKSQWK